MKVIHDEERNNTLFTGEVNMKATKSTMRDIPSINSLLDIVMKEPEFTTISHEIVVYILRKTVEETRDKVKQNPHMEISKWDLAEKAKEALRSLIKPSLRKVINATGIVLHTNLGRAPLGEKAAIMMQDVITGYCNLEYDLATGKRGNRYENIVEKLCLLTGAEDAIVVNNNAAAVLLVLSALAHKSEVVVSRGQLVEIGGSFRVSEILEQSGASLVEIGTTNKTHIKDYEKKINEKTALILKVHTSNYRIIGFTSQPEDKELVALAHSHELPIVYDLGSGTLLPINKEEWHEPTIGQCLATGIDIVTFSGDKLLGSGQAGIIAGKKSYINKLKTHPLLRAIRIDKLSLVALEGTLIEYIEGSAKQNIPVQCMLRRQPEELKELANKLAQMLQELTQYGWEIDVIPLNSQSGGGTLPGVNFESFGVSVIAMDKNAAQLEEKLRKYTLPIIIRIQEGRILFDMRCLSVNDLKTIQTACMTIAQEAIQ